MAIKFCSVLSLFAGIAVFTSFHPAAQAAFRVTASQPKYLSIPAVFPRPLVWVGNVPPAQAEYQLLQGTLELCRGEVPGVLAEALKTSWSLIRIPLGCPP
jgi:hypothetical protein